MGQNICLRLVVMAYVQTIFPGYRPEGFYDKDNIEFLRQKIVDVLRNEYKQDILLDHGSLMRVMQRVHEERMETVAYMNQRVIMYVANEFRNHQNDVNKRLRWAKYYPESQKLYDPSTERGPILDGIKLRQRISGARDVVGGTTRFYFT